MRWIWRALYPVLAYLLISETVAYLFGTMLDSSACTAVSALVTLAFAAVLYRKDVSLREKKGERRKLFSAVWIAVLSFFLGALLNAAYSAVLDLMKITSVFSNEAQEALFGSALVSELLGPGLLVPVAEELVFRGLSYSRMRENLSVMASVLLSSALFALCHGNPIQMIYAFPMAVILSLLYEKGESLLYPTAFHMGANLAAIFATALF